MWSGAILTKGIIQYFYLLIFFQISNFSEDFKDVETYEVRKYVFMQYTWHSNIFLFID